MTDEEKVLAAFEEVKGAILKRATTYYGDSRYIKTVICTPVGYAFVRYDTAEQRFESIEYKNKTIAL